MKTVQAIQASAQVVRITEIKAGDVYKRFDDREDDCVYYGIVRAINNDGEKTIIEATEYQYKWSDLKVSYRIIRGENDYILFPCSPEELNLELDKARREQVKVIENSEDKIERAKMLLAEIDGIVSRETLKALTTMSYKEMTQELYNEKKKALL